MPLTIYFISGLGADRRVFENLRIPGNVTIKHIDWIEPLYNESLQEYSKRLSEKINTSEEFMLIGMSLGGMVSVELNKIMQPKHTILISSIATRKEFPPHFRLIHATRLNKIIPTFLYKIPNPFVYWIFGANTPREKELIRSFMKHVTNKYLRWSINAVLKWKNQWRPDNMTHIHGTTDRILPFKFTHANILILNGGHFMVHNKADQVSASISKIILPGFDQKQVPLQPV